MKKEEKSRGRPRQKPEAGNIFFKLPASYSHIINEYKLKGDTNVEFVKRAIDFYCAYLDFHNAKDFSEPQMSLSDVAQLIKLIASSK